MSVSDWLARRVRPFVEDIRRLRSDEEQDRQRYNLEYLSGQYYDHIVTDADLIDDGFETMCGLCGRQFTAEETPDLFDHVASHDSQGAAEIDPFEGKVEAKYDYSDLLTEQPENGGTADAEPEHIQE